MERIRVFEAFAGYGSQSLALKRLKNDYPEYFDFNIVGYSEIEPSAIKAYNALHSGVRNFGDISKIDWRQVGDFDLFTYSFPCTDISSAGQQRGFSKNSGTRSSLLWECEKAILAKKPKYLLMENVPDLLTPKFKGDFLKWIELLEQYDYKSFCGILNAKNYGIPQNRDRVFLVSILNYNLGYDYQFPKPCIFRTDILQFLETNVDEKYWRFRDMPKDNIVDLYTNAIAINDNDILVNLTADNCIKTIRSCYGRVAYNCILMANSYGTTGIIDLSYRGNKEKLRKFTPREIFRFMDVDESDIDILLNAGICESDLYKMGGNSIVVSVLYNIFRTIFVLDSKEYNNIQLKLF